MNYSLNAGEWNSVFAVPASVVDKYIKIAGENSLKLLLYLLRHGGKNFSEDKLRSDLGFNEAGELEDAALFWIQRGIIRYENDGENRALFSEKTENEQAEQLVITESVTQKAHAKEKIKPALVSSGDIAKRINSDSEIKMLFDEAERLYAHPLKSNENQMLITITDHFGLNVGVSLMLLRYCFKIGKTTPAYILSCAQNWSDEGIDSVEAANDKILALEKNNSVCERLCAAMELKSKLTAKMKEFIRVWTEEWSFSEEMIMLCYEKTVNAKQEFKFEYANKILENWKNAGLFTKEAVQSAEAARKKPVKTASTAKNENSSFDVNDVVERIKQRRLSGG
ncbi:MAG: DnaD domain protein [Oscillospiraceae bacterium]|nr:DnaD domain protein [Oscillospiraceae bacterium]